MKRTNNDNDDGQRGQLSEQQAHDEVLRLCGKTPAGGWVMRTAPSNPLKGYEWAAECRVINLSPMGVAPHREIVAEADTWAECLEQIRGEL